MPYTPMGNFLTDNTVFSTVPVAASHNNGSSSDNGGQFPAQDAKSYATDVKNHDHSKASSTPVGSQSDTKDKTSTYKKITSLFKPKSE